MAKLHLFLITAMFLLLSCNVERRQLMVQKEMTKAEFLMENNPDSAHSLLLSMDTMALRESQTLKMEYYLLLANAQNRSGHPMMALESFLPILEYYEKEGNLTERMLASYLAGRICILNHESPMAMEYFQKVVEMVGDANETYDYRTLYRTHTQMAEIYHNQHIYQKAVDECMAASAVAMEHQDTLFALYAKEIAIRPLSLMGKYAEVIQLSEECANAFEKMGRMKDAVVTRQDALLSYIMSSRYEDAAKVIQDYEKLSGIFDKNGKIAKGLEMYYYKKGVFYLNTGQKEYAETEFRRLLSEQNTLNSQEAAYRGLLQLYTASHNRDSIGKYALLYCEVHDSVYKHKVADDVIQIESMYNYSRSKLIAESKSKEVQTLRFFILAIVLLVGVCIILSYLFVRQLTRRKTLEKGLMQASFEAERDRMNSRLEDMKGIADEYSKTINCLQDQLLIGGMNASERVAFIDAVESEDGILVSMRESLLPSSKRSPILDDKEKDVLLKYLEVKFLNCYKISLKYKLNKEEMLLVVLILLDFDDYQIKLLMNLSATNFSNRKRRISNKMFLEDNVRNLRNNIQSLS